MQGARQSRIHVLIGGVFVVFRCYLIAALIGLFTSLAVGCATPRSSPNAATDSIFLEARVLNALGDSVLVDYGHADPTVALGAIPGAIRGGPSRTLQFIHLTDAPRIVINAKALRVEALKESSVDTDDSLIGGLNIDPPDTRFARVSTTFMKRGAPANGMAVGIIDPVLMNPLTLFYFDRPCRISGVVTERGVASPITYDAHVEKSGLTWLVATRQVNGERIVRVADEPIRKMFVAAPAENLKDGQFQIR